MLRLYRRAWSAALPARESPLGLFGIGLLNVAMLGPSQTVLATEIAAPDSELSYFEPIPVVVTASRLSQPLNEAPVAITIIDREMIELSGATQIADLLRLVPGFQVAMSSLDHAYAVTYHGQADALPRRMEVLVDGRSVYSSLLSVDWHGLGVQLEDIERIEVSRGPGSPAYGSNAFIGTVNIITRQPFQDPGQFARLTVGSRDTVFGMLRQAGGGDDYDYRLTLEYDQTDGFKGRNDEKIVRSADFRGQYNATVDDLLDLHLGFRNGPVGRGGDSDLLAPVQMSDDKKVEGNHQQLRWNHALETGRDTYLQFYRNYHKEDDDVSQGLLSAILGVPPSLIPGLFPGHEDEEIRFGYFDHVEERYDLEWQLNDSTDSRTRWLVGAGLRLDRLRSPTNLGREDFVDDFSQRAFAQVSHRLTDAWLLNAGGMLEHGDLLGTEPSYRIGLNRFLSPTQTLRAAFTRSVRRVGLNGEYYALAPRFSNGDPIDMIAYSEGDIDPETLYAYELGYLGFWFDRKLMLDLKAYREEIRREIRARYEPDAQVPEYAQNGAFIFQNGGGVDIQGFEAQLQYRPAPGSLLSVQYAYAEANDRYDPMREGLPSREGNTPRHTFSLLAGHRLPWDLELSVAYYHLDSMNWGGDGGSAGTADAYDRVDLRLAKRFRWPRADGLIELIAHNIGGSYEEGRPDNLFDTRYFLRGSVQFH